MDASDGGEFSSFRKRKEQRAELLRESNEGGTARHSYINTSFATRKESIGIMVAIPCYNEEVAIGSIVLSALRYADNVVVIDDGSKDNTAKVAELAGAEVIVHEQNLGKGAAVKTAFLYASKSNFDILVFIDGDGQHNPEEIPKLVFPILAGEADVVNGSRYLNGKDKNTPRYRRIGQVVLDAATNVDSGLHVTDTQSGFRAFAMHTASAFRFRTTTHFIESEMLIDAAQKGLRIKEVEIGVRYDVGRPKTHPIHHGLRVLVKVLHDMELRRPLYYFVLPGLALLTIGVTTGLGFLDAFSHGETLPFGPTLMIVLVTLVGVFMAFTGIILHSMSKLLHEFKKTSTTSLFEFQNLFKPN